MTPQEEKLHAILSPSSAERWLACTPSARLEELFPDTTSEAAKEGTLAHALGELKLRHLLGRTSTNKDAKELLRIQESEYYNTDMFDYAGQYADYVFEVFTSAQTKTPDAVIGIEVKLDMTDYVPEGFGTGDAVIIADGTMHIIDLKYGKGVRVECENNKQMMLYALGALKEYDILYDINRVEMTIFQPRIDNINTWSIKAEDLKAWAETELKPKAELAHAGEGEFVTGDHCRFCRAKNTCRALAEKNLEIAKYEFRNPDLLEDDEIADILSRTDVFLNWLKGVNTYALSEAIDKGKKWAGFKLVEGRSIRTYADTDQVAKTLIENGIPEAIIFEKKLLGITAMEKAITKKTFNALLTDLIIKPAGSPTLVPESDKRPEYNIAKSAAEDFADDELL